MLPLSEYKVKTFWCFFPTNPKERNISKGQILRRITFVLQKIFLLIQPERTFFNECTYFLRIVEFESFDRARTWRVSYFVQINHWIGTSLQKIEISSEKFQVWFGKNDFCKQIVIMKYSKYLISIRWFSNILLELIKVKQAISFFCCCIKHADRVFYKNSIFSLWMHFRYSF